MSVLGTALGWIMSIIYNVIHNYGLSIIIFTLFTKVLLFPLSLLTQKNSINMVKMMPEENKSILSDFIAGKTHLKQRLRLFKDRRFRCSDRETYHNFQMAVLMNIY